MSAAQPHRFAVPRWRERPAWARAGVLIGVGWLVLLALFHTDTIMLADVYWNSSIYEHCLVIPPVIAWLVWQRRDVLRQIAPTGWAGGLAWMAAGLLCWLVGYASDVNVARHLGLIVMLQGLALALIGPNAGRALLFPFAYSLFLLPVGDQLVPPLQTLTADLSMAMLAMSGVAASLNGIFITTDAGLFRVAEACAGVNFLIAMVALAVLVANVAFRSWHRRIAFIAAAIIMSIVGNGVRAWGTMMIAHWFGIEHAAGFDHIFYGWFFFALLTALLVGIAWRCFDRAPGEHGLDGADYQRPVRFALKPAHALVLALVIALPGAWMTATAAASADLPARPFLPDVGLWWPVATPGDYLPNYPGADHRIIQRYRNDAGQQVDLFLALYSAQGEGREVVAVNQGGVDLDHEWVWTADDAPLRAEDATARVERLTAPDKRERLSAIFYRLGGETTGDSVRVKWLMLKQRLLGGDPRAAAIVISAEGEGAREAIAAFVASVGPVGAMADRVSGASGQD